MNMRTKRPTWGGTEHQESSPHALPDDVLRARLQSHEGPEMHMPIGNLSCTASSNVHTLVVDLTVRYAQFLDGTMTLCAFTHVIFEDCVFENYDVDHCYFESCIFVRCTFLNSEWAKTTFKRLTFKDCFFRGASWWGWEGKDLDLLGCVRVDSRIRDSQVTSMLVQRVQFYCETWQDCELPSWGGRLRNPQNEPHKTSWRSGAFSSTEFKVRGCTFDNARILQIIDPRPKGVFPLDTACSTGTFYECTFTLTGRTTHIVGKRLTRCKFHSRGSSPTPILFARCALTDCRFLDDSGILLFKECALDIHVEHYSAPEITLRLCTDFRISVNNPTNINISHCVGGAVVMHGLYYKMHPCVPEIDVQSSFRIEIQVLAQVAPVSINLRSSDLSEVHTPQALRSRYHYVHLRTVRSTPTLLNGEFVKSKEDLDLGPSVRKDLVYGLASYRWEHLPSGKTLTKLPDTTDVYNLHVDHLLAVEADMTALRARARDSTLPNAEVLCPEVLHACQRKLPELMPRLMLTRTWLELPDIQ